MSSFNPLAISGTKAGSSMSTSGTDAGGSQSELDEKPAKKQKTVKQKNLLVGGLLQ